MDNHYGYPYGNLVNTMSEEQPIYFKNSTVQKFHTLMHRSRKSPLFGSPRELNSFDEVANLLLDFALRYNYQDLKRIISIPLVSGEIKEEVFDNEEQRNKIIKDQFEELENGENAES